MHQLGLPKFSNSPLNAYIAHPRRISNSQCITIGDNLSFGPGCWLVPITIYPTSKMAKHGVPLQQQHFTPKIIIGNNVTATANIQIFAQARVVVEDDVMFASNIFINDGSHGFLNANTPYKYQPIFRIQPVTIKRGCWIGQNVVIMPGVTIGEFSIIGANSVVTKDVPSQCIAAGSPASVLKRWDRTKQAWLSEHS